jgi:hypothetical protein
MNDRNFNGKIFETSDSEDAPVVKKVVSYLEEHYEIRKDVISQNIEWRKRGVDGEFRDCNLHDLHIELQCKKLEYPFAELRRLMRQSTYLRTFDPFYDYFEHLPVWDGHYDWSTEFAQHIETDRQIFFLAMFKKALVRSIACALGTGENRIVFVLAQEKQHTGKSTFIRFLNPWGTERYYTESPLAKDGGKDIESSFKSYLCRT